MMSNKGQGNAMWIVLAVIALLLFSNGSINLGGGNAPQTPSAPQQPTGLGGLTCSDEDQSMVIGPFSRRGRTTAVTTEYADWYIAGIRQGIVASGSSQNVKIGDQVTIITAANSSRAYAAKQTLTVPCGRFNTADPKYDPTKANSLVFNTSWTTTVFNPSNKNENTAADNESITDGENAVWLLRLEAGGSDEGWAPFALTEGDKKGWISSFDMNQTDFAEGETKLTVGGQSMKAAPTPSAHPSPGTGFTTKSFYVTAVCDLVLSDVCKIELELTTVSETGINPGPDTGTGLGTINWSKYDTDFERSAFEPNDFLYGVEDDNSNLTGQHARQNAQVTALLYR